jgi:mannose-6-phosphate isomerase-like protein (cupin superfamily)
MSKEASVNKVNLAAAFSSFSDHWSPKIAGDINDMQIKLAKLKGDFVWHHHQDEDELFLVMSGSLVIHFRDRDITLSKGEFLIVPRGVEHKPEAAEECEVVLFERNTTVNTGNVVNDRTVGRLDL